MHPVLATFSLGLLVMTSFADQPTRFPTDLSRWHVTERPTREGDQWRVANGDKHEWGVSHGDAGPRADLRPRGRAVPAPLPFKIEPGSALDGLAGERKSVRVDDGWVVSFNAGEFGAGVWWFSPDGARRDKLSGENVVDLVPTTSGLLAFEGLAHRGLTAGKVARLSRAADGRWRSETVLDLGHVPWAVTKDADGSLVVVTSDRLLRVIPSTMKLEVILPHLPWGTAYPNSVAVAPSGTIYVGMRRYVAKVERAGTAYKLRWLVPSETFEDQEPTGWVE